jgi:hypothetical protein
MSLGIQAPLGRCTLDEQQSLLVLKKVCSKSLLRREKSLPISIAIQKIRDFPATLMHKGLCDGLIVRTLLRAVHVNDRKIIQDLAYSIFAKTDLPDRYCPPYILLQNEIYFLQIPVADIAKLVYIIFELWKAESFVAKTSFESIDEPSVAPYLRINPEAKITVSHGGGLRFIQEFLSGKSRGYSSHGEPLGIWVTPQLAAQSREEELRYGSNTPHRYLDTPAAFTATIQAKYLHGNGRKCEAKISARDVSRLENICIRTLEPRRESLFALTLDSLRAFLPPKMYRQLVLSEK